MRNNIVIIFLLILLPLLSCSELGEENPLKFVEYQLSYEQDIKPIFSNRCISCHSGSNPEGNYDLSSILKIIDNGSDPLPNVIIGSPNSLLLEILVTGDSNHDEYIGSQENYQKLYKWIVEDSLSINKPIVHLAGPMDVDSPNFHGQDIRKKAWSMESCKLCHGTDYAGGSSESSCNICHDPNPEDCNLCHGGLENKDGAPPPDLSDNTDISARGVGAHTIHLKGTDLSLPVKCEECHIIPQAMYDDNHIFSSEPAEVIFSGLALTLDAEPVWNTQTLTCENVYCHGNFPSGNKDYKPKWTQFDPEDKTCSPTCHGLPPDGTTRKGYKHSDKVPQCWYCHINVIDENNNFYDKSTHINGIADR